MTDMNLIEQLGGYEATKEKYQALSDSDMITIGPVEFSAKDYFEDELLEYRRQHNIFEVKDKVVFTDKYSNNILLTITELTCSYAFTSMEFGEISFDSVRHADDAEIKAGKRLEVNDGN